MRGDEQHWPFWVERVQLGEQLQPAPVRQLQIEHDHVGCVPLHGFQAGGGGCCCRHFDSHPAEHSLDGVTNARLVIDHQKRCHETPPRRKSPSVVIYRVAKAMLGGTP